MFQRVESNRIRDDTKHCSTSFTVFLILFRFLTIHTMLAESFSNSIPLSECSPMESIHGVQPQQGPHPFTTYADKREITNNGDVVELALTIKQRSFGLVSFKGYLLMAFGNESDETDVPVGSFSLPSDGQVVSCPNGLTLNNAVTHQSSDDKQLVTVYWTPPEDYVGLVKFRTTYLRNGTLFWINTPAAYPVRVVNPIITTFPTSTDSAPFATSSSTGTSYSEMGTSDEGCISETTTEEISFNITEDESNFTNTFTEDRTTMSSTMGLTSTTRSSGGGPSSEVLIEFNLLLTSFTFWASCCVTSTHR